MLGSLRRPSGRLVWLGVVAGLAVRAVIARTPLGVLDSDEAVVGLMARHFTMGSFRAFFWGQTYGGTVETAITAGLYRVFGTSIWALRIVPAAFSGLSAILVWRIGRRIAPPGAAVAAALLVWLWPANYIWWSIKARGFYEVTLFLSLACALLALRIAQRSGSAWLNWALFGACAGIGWWQTPQIAYIVVPLSAWLIVARRWEVWRAVAALPAAALGAAPWLVANIKSGFASLVTPKSPVPGTYGDHLVNFANQGLPMTLGLKVVYLKQWTTAQPIGIALTVAAVALIVIGIAQRRPGSLVLGLIVGAYPFLNALLTLSGTTNEGRYTLFLMPWLAIAMARAAKRRPALSILVTAVLLVSAVGIDALRGQTSPFAPDTRVPTSLRTLEQSMFAHGVTRAWANYWVAYRLTFETDERVIAAPSVNGRYPMYDEMVGAAGRPVFIFLAASRDTINFRRGLRARHIAFAGWTVGDTWDVYLPAAHVDPTEIPGSYP